jgi:hypothetical protein
MLHDNRVAGWIRSYRNEEDVTFYWEVGDDAWITRHVELAGQGQVPRAAASPAKWTRELEAGRIQQYQAKYGFLADQPVTPWDLTLP